MAMNLGHRVADNPNGDNLDVIYHKVKYPLNIAIPVLLIVLSFWSVWQYFGSPWKTGTLSLVFLPFIGQPIGELLQQNRGILLSQLVLVSYAFGAVSFYYFFYFLTKRHFTAVTAALLLLLPVIPFSSDPPDRLILSLVGSDGAHIIGVTLTPWILSLFLSFVRNGGRKQLILSVSTTALLGLISFFSFFLLIVYELFITLSEILVGQGKLKFFRFLKKVALSLVVLLLFYNISILKMFISEQGATAFAVVSNLLPMTFFIVPVTGTFAFLIFDRRPVLQPLFLALTYLLVFGLLNFVRIFVVDVPILNQSRYAPEAHVAVAFFIGLLLTYCFDLLRGDLITHRFPQLAPWRTHIAFGFSLFVVGSILACVLFIPRSV
jgi:hypothetical protein